jgi:hypothetical protein
MNEYAELQCNRCKQWRSLDEYYYPSEGPSWYIIELSGGVERQYRKPSSWCKSCMRENQLRGRSDAQPERIRAADAIAARARAAQESQQLGPPPRDLERPVEGTP